MWYRRTARPEDVTAWEPERTFPTNTPGSHGFTYPNPVRLPAEGDRIYLFWRGGNFNPSFATSGNGGSSWSAARTLISNPGQRPYIKYDSNHDDTIAMAYTEAHPRNLQTSIYYAAYQGGALRRADGSVISSMDDLPIGPTEGEKIYDWHTNGKAWVHDVALDAEGHPVIVDATFPSNADHRYRYARWNGSAWTDRELVRAGRSISVSPREPNYSGGITLDHEDPSTVYLSRQVAGVFETEVWTTPDQGRAGRRGR
jgi:BNR repeat-containing family member